MSMDLVYDTVDWITEKLSGRDKHTGGEEEQGGHFAVELKHDVGRPDFGEAGVGLHRAQNIPNKLEADTHFQHFSYLLTELRYQLATRGEVDLLNFLS